MYQGSRWVPSVWVAIRPPLAGAMDSFPSTATLVIQQNGFGEPFPSCP